MTSKKITEFPNQINPNPVTALDMRTQEGTALRFAFHPPIQQSKMVAALGLLHALLDVEVNIQLPEEALMIRSLRRAP